MKKNQIIKSITSAVFVVAMMVTTSSAIAQHRGSGGGGGFRGGGSSGGGSFHPSAPASGGGSFHPSAPASSGGGRVSAPAPSSGSGNRIVTNGTTQSTGLARGTSTYAGRAGGVVHPSAPIGGGNYAQGGNYSRGYYSRGYGYGGYGYRGYGLGIFSPYAIYPFYPTLGLRLGFLPFGYYSFYYDGYPYYYYNSVFYRRTDDNYYEITAPPLGAKVTSIPSNSKVVVVNGNTYYECNGTYYQEEADANGQVIYVVVGTDGVLNQPKTPQVVYEPQVGDIIPQLPSNCSTVFLNGQKYYESPDNVYYLRLS